MPEPTPDPNDGRVGGLAAPMIDALSVIWCPHEPSRLGELLLVPSTSGGGEDELIFGRGTGDRGNAGRRLLLCRDRPGRLDVAPPLVSDHISRDQLAVRSLSGTLLIRSIGRLPLFVDGIPSNTARIAPGQVVQLGQQLALLFVRRQAWLPPIPEWPPFPFGEPDADGMVGESPVTWQLRRQITFIAARHGHVLVCGATGTGKELVSQAIHRASARAHKPIVSRNAATIPESLIDAELFGNARNYPNIGMTERLGLIGQADGSTLFLDEIGELSSALQTRLLRVLDGGEYQRLGEAKTRHVDFRLLGATNSPGTLRLDLASRFTFRIDLPLLNERREDIPLLVKLILSKAADSKHSSAGYPIPLQPTATFMRRVVQHRYTANVRELNSIIWNCIQHASGPTVDWVPVPADLANSPSIDISELATTRVADPRTITAAEIQECLDSEKGELDRVWKKLGLRSRFALYRLVKKHGLRVERR